MGQINFFQQLPSSGVCPKLEAIETVKRISLRVVNIFNGQKKVDWSNFFDVGENGQGGPDFTYLALAGRSKGLLKWTRGDNVRELEQKNGPVA